MGRILGMESEGGRRSSELIFEDLLEAKPFFLASCSGAKPSSSDKAANESSSAIKDRACGDNEETACPFCEGVTYKRNQES
jgi:hypothetical protein